MSPVISALVVEEETIIITRSRFLLSSSRGKDAIRLRLMINNYKAHRRM